MELKCWRRYIIFKIWHTLWPGDVINDVMNVWNIICTTRHPQQWTSKILFLWHQSFIVKSSGQTSWQRYKQTNKQTNKQTRMWNMISSPATPTVCPEQKSENIQSQRDIIDAVTISKIIVFELICNFAYFSAAKFTFPVEQPSNKATKCGIRRSWKLKVKQNHGCCSNIAITISYISVFCFILIRLAELWPFKCQGHPVNLWCWPWTCNLETCYSLRSSFGMYNLERQLWYLHLLMRHCPCNLLPQPTSPKHEYRGKFWGHPVA